MFTVTLDKLKEHYEKISNSCYVLCYDCNNNKIAIFIHSDLDVVKKEWEKYKENDCLKTVIVDLKTMEIVYS